MKLGKNVQLFGTVHMADDCVIQDNVVLGHQDNGELRIGQGALIRSGSIIYSGVTIGRDFRTGHNILVRENTIIGDDVLIGTNSVVDGNCTIGNGVRVQTNVYVTAHTIIGDKVFMGPCCVTTNDKYMIYGAKLKGPIIGDSARIGAAATILPGVQIGAAAVVGAGAVVTRDVPMGAVVVGVPARQLKTTRNRKVHETTDV